MSDLTDELGAQITAAGPAIAAAFGALIGLVFVIALAGLIIRRVRGTVK